MRLFSISLDVLSAGMSTNADCPLSYVFRVFMVLISSVPMLSSRVSAFTISMSDVMQSSSRSSISFRCFILRMRVFVPMDFSTSLCTYASLPPSTSMSTLPFLVSRIFDIDLPVWLISILDLIFRTISP